MYKIENDKITKVIAIGDIRSLVQISVINNKQMVVQFLNDCRPTDKWKREEIAKYIHEWFDLDNDLTPFLKWQRQTHYLKCPSKILWNARYRHS